MPPYDGAWETEASGDASLRRSCEGVAGLPLKGGDFVYAVFAAGMNGAGCPAWANAAGREIRTGPLSNFIFTTLLMHAMIN